MSPYFVGEKQLVPTYVNPINSSVGKKGWYKDGGGFPPFWRKIGKRENRQWSLPRIMDDGWGRRETGPWSIASRIVPTKLMHMYARSFFAKYRIGRFHAYPGFLPRLFRVKRATRTQELKICFVAVGFYVLSFPPWFFFLLCLVVRKTVRRPK